MDGDVPIVGLGVDPVHAVVLEQRAHHGGERLAGQAGALMIRRERHTDLGRRRLVGQDAYRTITAEHPCRPVDRGQLHPSSRLAERRLALRREEPLGVGRRVRRVPGLVARDLRGAAVGDEGRQVAGLERSQPQPLADAFDHGTIVRVVRACGDVNPAGPVAFGA
jgi:hypothetical protein